MGRIPESNKNELYIDLGNYQSIGFSELIDEIKNHFKIEGDFDIDDFKISPEYHQVDCFGYDRYDPSDYSNFLCITKIT
jgi:hypothetical protein